jgi:dihydrofolate reductase
LTYNRLEIMRISMIAAVAQNGVIGRDNDLVWRLRDDMQFFSETTRGHHVLMGRRNFESIPERFRPLADRPNGIISRNAGYTAPGAEVFTDLHSALDWARQAGETECFIIGGAQIYTLALALALPSRMYLTHVHATPEGDAFFPDFPAERWTRTVLHQQPRDARNEHPFDIYQYDLNPDFRHA